MTPLNLSALEDLERRAREATGQPLDQACPLVVMGRGNRLRAIPAGKWWINRNTPVGEDAEILERMPYGGRREINRRKIVGQDPALLSALRTQQDPST